MTTMLVGVDASDRSHDALAFARRLAAPAGADLLVANVFPYDRTPSRASSSAYEHALAEEAQALVGRVAAGTGDVRTTVIGRRSSSHGLHDLAEREGAALIVVGSSHVGVAGRVLPGSTAERLLHGASCPVAVVPKGYASASRPIATIGVAYDGSPEARAALDAGATVAAAIGATVRVIGVLDPLPFDATYATLSEDAERDLRAQLERAAGELAVPAEPCFRLGDPVHELARQSASLDLLITGSRGYGPLRAVLTGGVTGPLLREAACPMLVLPRGVTTSLGALLTGAAASA